MLEILWFFLLILGPIIYLKGRSMEKKQLQQYEILTDGEVITKKRYKINEYSGTILGEYK